MRSTAYSELAARADQLRAEQAKLTQPPTRGEAESGMAAMTDALSRLEIWLNARRVWSETSDGQRWEAIQAELGAIDEESKRLTTAHHRVSEWLHRHQTRRGAMFLDQFRPGTDEHRESRARVLDACVRWIDAHERSSWPDTPVWCLALVSRSKGTGKTHLATGIATEWVARGMGGPRDVLRLSVSELFRRVRSTFGGGSTSEADANLLDRCARCRLLVLDDLGSHRGTQWEMEALWGIFDYRYASSRPTVLTSNEGVGRGEWRRMVAGMECEHEQHAERIVSRLLDGGVVLPTEWVDWRALGADARASAGLAHGERVTAGAGA